MSIVKWFTDTETTGLLKDLDQILTFAVVLEKKDQTLKSYERNIKLKENILPSAGAMLVNKINPFTKEYQDSSISEYEAYLHLKNVLIEARKEGRVVMIAYNLKFDDDMYSGLFKRYGDDFNKYVDHKFDPLPTARKLVESGEIVTKEIKTAYGKTYKTAKLEEVFIGLGFDNSLINAHSALDDTKMLQMATHAIYFLATERKLDDISCNPSSWKEGDVVEVIGDTESGLKTRVFKVLKQLENKIIALNIEEGTEVISKTIQEFNHNEFMDEVKVVDKQKVENLNFFYDNNKKDIEKIIEDMSQKLLKQKPKKELDFKEVIALSEKLISNPQALKTLTPEEKKLEAMAEDYSYGVNNRGWRREVIGDDLLTRVRKIKMSDTLVVGLDSVGEFILLENDQEILRTDKKTLLEKELLSKEVPKEEIKKIPPSSTFKNAKHPTFIKQEFDNKKGEVFGGSDKHKKDILVDLLKYYKIKSPQFFENESIPSFKLDLTNFLKNGNK